MNQLQVYIPEAWKSKYALKSRAPFQPDGHVQPGAESVSAA